ncbi:uncharacterized protein METZ01_LOCUS402068, partial [marine metagenome]
VVDSPPVCGPGSLSRNRRRWASRRPREKEDAQPERPQGPGQATESSARDIDDRG